MKIEEYECFLLTSLVQAQMLDFELLSEKEERYLFQKRHHKMANTINCVTLMYDQFSKYLAIDVSSTDGSLLQAIRIPLSSKYKFGGCAIAPSNLYRRQTFPFVEEKYSFEVQRIFSNIQNALVQFPTLKPIFSLIEDWLVCVDWNKLELDSSKLLELTKARYES